MTNIIIISCIALFVGLSFQLNWGTKYIFKPHYWIMNNPYSQDLDEYLTDMLESADFTNIGTYRATIGEIELWTENHPYSSFTYKGRRPSRKTIEALNSKLFKQQFNKEILTNND